MDTNIVDNNEKLFIKIKKKKPIINHQKDDADSILINKQNSIPRIYYYLLIIINK